MKTIKFVFVLALALPAGLAAQEKAVAVSSAPEAVAVSSAPEAASVKADAEVFLKQADEARLAQKYARAILYVRQAAKAGANVERSVAALRAISETAMNSITPGKKGAGPSAEAKEMDLEACQAAVELAPNSSKAHELLGVTLSSVFSKHNEAVREFRQALALDRKNMAAWSELIGTLFKANRFQERIQVIEDRSALTGRRDHEYFSLLGDSECELNHFETAMDRYETSLELMKRGGIKDQGVRARYKACKKRGKKR